MVMKNAEASVRGPAFQSETLDVPIRDSLPLGTAAFDLARPACLVAGTFEDRQRRISGKARVNGRALAQPELRAARRRQAAGMAAGGAETGQAGERCRIVRHVTVPVGFYLARNATAGSIRAARRAGM